MSILSPRDYFKPFDYPWAYEKYKLHEQMHWLPESVTMHEDVNDWANKLTEAEKSLLTSIFRFFVQADCFPVGTDILTEDGWLPVEKLETYQGRVAQVTAIDDVFNGDLSFARPNRVVSKYTNEPLVRFVADRKPVDVVVTPRHNMLYSYEGALSRVPAEEVNLYQNKKLPIAGWAVGSSEGLSSEERLAIAFQADGNLKKDVDGSKLGGFKHRFSFKKERKAERLQDILVLLDYEWEVTYNEDSDYWEIWVLLPTRMDKDFSWVTLADKSHVWCREFMEEVSQWDSHITDEGVFTYSNTNEMAVDKVQAVAACAGMRATKSVYIDERSDKFSPVFRLHVSPYAEVDCQYVRKEEYPYSGFVYCVSMPQRTVVTRFNGKVTVSGNCDVAGGYYDAYLPKVQCPEVRMMMGSFAAREAVHQDAYSLLIDTVGMPEQEYQMFQEYAEMSEKHEYLLQDRPLLEDIAVFSAFGEGLQLFASFVMLMSFPRRNLMKGMGQIVQWSIKDESVHVDGMVQVFHTIKAESNLSDVETVDLVNAIYDHAEKMVDLEDKFIDLAFAAGPIEGLDKEDVKKYIRYVANIRLRQLGCIPIFGEKINPLPWMDDMVSLPSHTNFFENRPVEYGHGGAQGEYNFDFD